MKLYCLLIALFVCAVLGQVRRTDFALHADGTCDSSTVCAVKSPSQELHENIDPNAGVITKIVLLQGAYAEWTFLKVNANSTNFVDQGNATFGTHLFRDHVFFFSALGEGYVLAGPDPTHFTFGAVYRVYAGQGVFNGANGIITITGVVDTSTNHFDFFISGFVYHTPKN